MATAIVLADSPTATPEDLNNYASFLNETNIPELKQTRVALAYAKRAVSAAKEPSLPLLSTLADAYFNAGDPNNAIVTAQRALASYPAPKGSGEAGEGRKGRGKVAIEHRSTRAGRTAKEMPVCQAQLWPDQGQVLATGDC